MKALLLKTKGTAEVTEVPVPELKPDYVRIKVHSVALNPTDWKHIFLLGGSNLIVGCDVAGVVEEVGSSVKTSVKKGDKIAGFVHGSNASYGENGAFAEYCNLKDGIFAIVPPSVSLQEASTLGVGVTTVGQGLYQSLKLPLPSAPTDAPFPVLIYGGSTATGTLAIQYAKLSGVTVLATSSPKNFDLLKSLGADAVFDYNDPKCGEQIRNRTDDSLRFVFDCISEGSSPSISATALCTNPPLQLRYSALLDVKDFPRSDVSTARTVAYTAVGEAYEKAGSRMDDEKRLAEDYEFAKGFWQEAQQLLEAGKLKTHPIETRSGGLDGILQGLLDLKEGKVSGKKLVYDIA